MRNRVNKILFRSDKMFAPALGESAPEADMMEVTVDETGMNNAEALGPKDINVEDNKILADEADELIQAHIREQSSSDEVEEPSTSDDEFPDVMDLIKKERRS
jgi:hypothetical protein